MQIFIQYLLFLSDFNQNWNVLNNFGQYVLGGKYQVLIVLTVSEDMFKNFVLSYVVQLNEELLFTATGPAVYSDSGYWKACNGYNNGSSFSFFFGSGRNLKHQGRYKQVRKIVGRMCWVWECNALR